MNELFKTEAKVEIRHSEKKNSDYYVLVVKLSSTYEETIFLNKAQSEIVKNSDLCNKQNVSLDSQDSSVFDAFK